MKYLQCSIAPLLFITAAHTFADLDTFGIRQFYQSKTESLSWTSAHWNNGTARTVRYRDDPNDPTGWTEDHSGSTNGFFIDGKGTMTMSGGGPRFHINSLDSSKNRRQFFRDIEFTAYYMRKGKSGKNWGGMVVGLRSGPLGHGSSGGNDCDATTYYARFRNDGKWDFEKELKHPGSTVWSTEGFGKQAPLWSGASLPENRWIGMKYIIYNSNNNTNVTLKLYIDSISNGTPKDGGTWHHIGTVVDSGNWESGDVAGCTYNKNSVILEGNGTVLMRTDEDTAIYTMVSIREIDPDKNISAATNKRGISSHAFYKATGRVAVLPNWSELQSYQQSSKDRLYTLRGEYINQAKRSSLRQKERRFTSPGIYLLKQ